MTKPVLIEDEKWLPISGYENKYWVSDKGHVKSRKKVLKPRETIGGYHRVGLHNHGKQKWITVHKLVLEAFLAEVPERPERGTDEDMYDYVLELKVWEARVAALLYKGVKG